MFIFYCALCIYHRNQYAIHPDGVLLYLPYSCMHHTNWYAIHRNDGFVFVVSKLYAPHKLVCYTPKWKLTSFSFGCMHHTNWYAIHHVYCNYLHNKLLGYLPSGKNSLSLKRYSPLELFFLNPLPIRLQHHISVQSELGVDRPL